MIIRPEEPIPIRIRPMQFEDLEAVTHIDQISFSLPWPASAFRQELAQSDPKLSPDYRNRNSIVRVAEVVSENGKKDVVGILVIWMILDEAHIATIATHPDYRRKGIAETLLAEGLAEAIERGATQATLEVRAHNLTAQNLYRKFGFEEVGRRPKYYRDNFEDALIMTLSDLKREYLGDDEIQDRDRVNDTPIE